MKNVLIISLIAIIFLNNTGLDALPNPFKQAQRLWQCRPSSAKRNNCTKKESAITKKWLIGASATAITAILAAIGIAGVHAYNVRQEQQMALPESQTEQSLRNPAEDASEYSVVQSDERVFEDEKSFYKGLLAQLDENNPNEQEAIKRLREIIAGIDLQINIIRNR